MLGDVISVVAAMPKAAATSLKSIVARERWGLNTFETAGEVRALTRCTRVPVIVTEVRLSDGTWQDLLQATEDLRPRPVLIITCKSPDHRLWAEALSCGAYDVLAQPFDPREVNHVISSAWGSWETAVSYFDHHRNYALR